MRRSNLLLCAILLLALTLSARAATYFSQGSLAPNVATSWNTNPTGGGATPPNFTTAADTFVIQTGHTMGSAWVVAGRVQINAGGKLQLTVSPGVTLGSLLNDGTINLNTGSVVRTLTVKGDLTNNGTINALNGGQNTTIAFSADGVWTGSGNLSGGRIQLVVNPGVTLDMTGMTGELLLTSGGTMTSTLNGKLLAGATVLNGNGNASHSFVMGAGAELVTAHSAGVNGTLDWSGTVSIDSGANFTFNGSAVQLTGTRLPAAINDLTINNAGGVILSEPLTVNGTLALNAGALSTSGSELLKLSAGSAVSGTGYVNGPLAWVYAATGSRLYPIGKGGSSHPLTLNHTSLTGTSTVTAEVFEAAMGGTPPAEMKQFASRYWSITRTGGTDRVFSLSLDSSGFTPVGAATILRQGTPDTSYSTTFSSPTYTAEGIASSGNFTLGDLTAGLDKLAFTSAPQSLVAGVTSGALTVQFQTAGGAPKNATANLLVNLSSTSGAGLFRNAVDTSSLTSVLIAAGTHSATFKYKDTASGIPILTASAAGVASGSQQQTVNAGTAGQLAFATQPVNTYATYVMSPVVVQVRDAYGSSVSQAGVSIALTLNGGAMLNGTTTQLTDSNGRATFTNLSVPTAANGRTLIATAAGPLTGTSTTFNISTVTDRNLLNVQAPNGRRIPKIIGASCEFGSTRQHTTDDYFQWYGITHNRFWHKPGFQSLNATGGVTNVTGFDAAVTAIRANPLRQGTASDVFIDWNYYNAEFDSGLRSAMQRFERLGIELMMNDTDFLESGGNPIVLTSWGDKFKYWRMWYGYVYYFASQHGLTMYQFRNEPNFNTSYESWESHWLVAADAMRKAMADVNRDYGTSLQLQICGPTFPGPYWDYSLPASDFHSWGSRSWSKVQTNLYGAIDSSIWNYGQYDYHRYRNNGEVNQDEIAGLRQDIASAANSPNATIPILITEYNTATQAEFTALGLDTEDLSYGIGVSQILQATATLGSGGLGNDGGLFIFRLMGVVTGTLGNKLTYTSNLDPGNLGGITRGGACFQMYARHFRGGKPLLGLSVTDGSSDQRRAVAVVDDERQGYYLYYSNVSGTTANVVLNLSALDVEVGAPVTVQRVSANDTGQITDLLALNSAKQITFDAASPSAILAWIPKGKSAAVVSVRPPTGDTYLIVGEPPTNHGAEGSMKVSLHHSNPAGRRVGLMKFEVPAAGSANRYLLKFSGRNIGASQSSREIVHVYGRPEGSWNEAALTWSEAPGVGRYSTSSTALSPTTGTGVMVDIEDTYAGTTVGAGLGLYGQFLGPVSFAAAGYDTNYLDVTDYVRSLQASQATAATFIFARIVRYNVNEYDTAPYYSQGVYDYDTRTVEIATKENSNASLQPALVSFGSAPLTWTGSPGNWIIGTNANWTSGGAATTYNETFGLGPKVLFDDTAPGTKAPGVNGILSPAEITVRNSTYNYTFVGTGKLSGPGALIKEGTGTLTINQTGINDYTGGTFINAGTLALNSPLISDVTVSGTGTIVRAASLTGNLFLETGSVDAARATPGLRDLTGDYALKAGASLRVRLNGSTPGTQHDQLIVSGSITLGGALEIITSSALPPGSTLRIIDQAGSAATSGTFSGKPESAIFPDGSGNTFGINYNAGTGNDVVLTVLASPLEQWRFTYFGSALNSGNATDNANPDGDAWTNSQEYVLGSNPTTANHGAIFALSTAGNNVILTFSAVQASGSGYNGLSRSYDVETTNDLANAASWVALAGYSNILGANQTVAINLPLTASPRFYRLKMRIEP